MGMRSQGWVSGTCILLFIIFCCLIEASHNLAGWILESHPAPYLSMYRESKHLMQPCEFGLWSWVSNSVIVVNIEMHEFLFGYHLSVWGPMLGYLIHVCWRLVPYAPYSLFICIWRTFWWVFFPLLLLLFSCTWHNWWSTCLLFLKISITLLFPGTFPQGTIHLVQSVALLTDWK